MTGFTTVFSALPLVLAVGPGSESRAVIGMVIFAGVLFSTFLTLFVIPTMYHVLARNTSSPEALSQQVDEFESQIPYRKGDGV
jgi:multidrug efflux pump